MRRELWIAAMLLGVTAVVTTPTSSVAQENGAGEAPLADEPSVRRKLLYRATRFEIQPSIGATMGEPYLNNFLTSLNLSYYFTNELGIGVTGSWSPVQWETSLAKNTRATLQSNDEQGTLNDLAYSYPQFSGGLEFKVVPIFGKMSLMNQSDVAYDLHLVAGVTLIQESTEPAVEDGSSAPTLEGVTPAGTFGLGLRVFVADSIAVNLQFRDHLYTTADAGPVVGSESLKSNVRATAGVSFFVPRTVKISR